MSMQSPASWHSVADALPMLRDVVSWQPIREWSLSSVHRITLQSGQTAIAKRSSNSLKGELAFYQSVLSPLGVEHPQMYAGTQTDTHYFVLMEDLGEETLEQQPSPQHFIAAAGKLAQIHAAATRGIREYKITNETWEKHYQAGQAFTRDATFLTRYTGLSHSDRSLLQDVANLLPSELESLYSECPVTLVHCDYYAKNLIICGDDIRVIDWTNAYFSPHLGDVYGLCREGSNAGIAKNDIVTAYCRSVGDTLGNKDTLPWRIYLGGVCWSVQAIRWVLTQGVHFIPGSEAWIPDMIQDLQSALADLRECART
ncbi:phosphotransferase family protein [Alicyclobacillus fodiniaquatilis]|uniref:Phosphotransferase family protein n=1 Tax=Alicyclobacillus fodiniaquatilis TaxID=1661150 RepID=A0ABW4JPM0_9BACL